VIVTCLILVTGSSIATDLLPTQTGWTLEDRGVLREVVEVMSKKETVEALEGLKTRPEAATEERQEALDLIIEAFSEDNVNGS